MRKNNQNLTMMRFVLLDYIGDIKGGLKRIQGGEAFVPSLSFVLMNLAWSPEFYGEGGKSFRLSFIWGDVVVVLIMLFGFLISRMYPGKLEKALLLCPLTEGEKRQYVKMGYGLKIAFPMLLYVLAGVFWQIFGTVSLFSTVVIGIWVLFYLGCVNMYCPPEQRKYPVKGLALFLCAAQILALGEIAGASYFVLGDSWKIKNMIYGGIITLLQIILYIIMRKKIYPIVMGRALCYENNN